MMIYYRLGKKPIKKPYYFNFNLLSNSSRFIILLIPLLEVHIIWHTGLDKH